MHQLVENRSIVELIFLYVEFFLSLHCVEKAQPLHNVESEGGRGWGQLLHLKYKRLFENMMESKRAGKRHPFFGSGAC